MVAKITEQRGATGAEFVCGEVLDVLREDTRAYNATYSIFECAWFTDPSRLFPLVRERLAPGGVFAFSHPPAIPGTYGPQGMYKGGFAGKAQIVCLSGRQRAGWRSPEHEKSPHDCGGFRVPPA